VLVMAAAAAHQRMVKAYILTKRQEYVHFVLKLVTTFKKHHPMGGVFILKESAGGI
jgi:hypothetical protein